MIQSKSSNGGLPSIRVNVIEASSRMRTGWLQCVIDQHVKFKSDALETYFFADWNPAIYDAFLVAAAVEFADRTQHRHSRIWSRDIALRIPVHDPEKWNQRSILEALHDSLDFLTGDRWHIEFYARKRAAARPNQISMALPNQVSAIIPYSNGLDSRAVAGLMAREYGAGLVRVRLGSKRLGDGDSGSGRQPFTAVPYKVDAGERPFSESTARSRGFKFALVSGIAAYLAGADQVIVPESGQGALGPSLAPVGQTYVDYRSHPTFTRLIERFLGALLERRIHFVFPRLWHTKGETLAKFVSTCSEGSGAWQKTWSCWQDNRHVSVSQKKRQCGICAACMLRRLSIHAAGLTEPSEIYVWENLGTAVFEDGVASAYDRKKMNSAMREYAIAGTLHLDHLAALRTSPFGQTKLALNAFQLSQACGLDEADVQSRLNRLLVQHEAEWKSFVSSLGQNSFVAGWAAAA